MFKNDGLKVAQFVYDFASETGVQAAYKLSAKAGYAPLPVGSIVINVVMKVVTAFTSGGAATLTVGNTTDADGYLTAIPLDSLVDNAVFTAQQLSGALLWDNLNDASLAANVANANDGDVSVTIGAAAFTAGKAILFVSYYSPSLT